MPPAITGKDIRKMEDSYEMSFRDTLTMNNARFSPSDKIRDSMSPLDIVSLHPDSEQSSSAQAFISAPASMEHPILKNLMNNLQALSVQFPDFQLLNPAIVQGGRLHIPREIYKQFAWNNNFIIFYLFLSTTLDESNHVEPFLDDFVLHEESDVVPDAVV